MKKLFLLSLPMLVLCSLNAQEAVLKPGSYFPNIVISDITNAPVKEFHLSKEKSNRYYILNFWGTWCSPCIPEMDSLAVLQRNNADKIQIIAISDDNEQRKAAYLKNKPSKIWLATDSAYTLYNMFNLAFVGQSAIIGPDKKIITLVKTDSINQSLLNKLFRGDSIPMNAGLKEIAIKTDDLFGIDTLTTHSFTIRGYKAGESGMSRLFLKGPFKNRRASWFNTSISGLYRSAYGIKSYKTQEFYDGVTEKDVADFENKSSLYCVDLLVSAEDIPRFNDILKQYLHATLPIKVREEQRTIPVYVLKRIEGIEFQSPVSTATESSYGFSGRGYDGTRKTIKDFAEEYLTNELGLPVVDETGIGGFYDIKTSVEQRNREGILKSIERLGLKVEKTERLMPVIIYYK